MMKTTMGLVFLISGFAQGALPGAQANFSKRMECTLQIPATGLPAIPRYQIEVGRAVSGGAYVLKMTTLRPLGLDPSYPTLQRVGVTENASLFQTTGVTAVVVSQRNSQSALLLTNEGLVYRCVSPKSICASGTYDADKDRCVFEGSVIPLPGKPDADAGTGW